MGPICPHPPGKKLDGPRVHGRGRAPSRPMHAICHPTSAAVPALFGSRVNQFGSGVVALPSTDPPSSKIQIEEHRPRARRRSRRAGRARACGGGRGIQVLGAATGRGGGGPDARVQQQADRRQRGHRVRRAPPAQCHIR